MNIPRVASAGGNFLSRESSMASFHDDGFYVARTNSLSGADFDLVSSSSPMLAPITTKIRPSSALTEKIIVDIADSIKIFKPSRSLYMLTSAKLYDDQVEEVTSKPAALIDVVISGGGLKGYYVAGCVAVLQRQLTTHNIEIARVSGASAGAWSAFFICTGVSTALWIESYHKLLENPERTIHEIYVEEMWPLIRSTLPEDAYKHCNGRLFISISVLTAFGLQNMVVSEFTSNDDMIEACLASSTIPFITEKTFCRKFRGLSVMDGGLTSNTPVFRDGIRRQLIFRLSQIEYPWRLLINPVDSCIDALVIRGALQMARFLGGEFVSSIAWLEQKQGESDLIRPGHTVRGVVAPLAVATLILFRNSFIPHVLNMFDILVAGGTAISKSPVINFSEADAEFRSNPMMYAVGTIFAYAVSTLRRFHLLL